MRERTIGFIIETMKRGLGVLLVVAASMGIASPVEAQAQSSNRRTTPGTTRAVDSPGRVRVRVRSNDEVHYHEHYDDDDVGHRPVHHRRERTGLWALVGTGFSLGGGVGVFDASSNPLSSARASHPAELGLLLPMAFDTRVWLVIDRLRLGAGGQVGPSPLLGHWEPRDGDAFEVGSRAEAGIDWAAYLFGAYQPQLSEWVQLWLGARLGVQGHEFPVVVNGRRYEKLSRSFVSVGPELGVRLSAGPMGVMLWGFADLTQPGSAQLIAAFVFEWPKPTGSAF